MANVPVRVNPQFYNLTNAGVDASCFKANLVGFSSERGISVTSTQNGSKTLTFVNFKNGFNVEQKQNPSDSSLTHPTRNIKAFRADKNNDQNNHIQIYDLDGPTPLKKVQIKGKFAYWKWVNSSTLAFITTDKVYHLDITKGLDEV